MFKTTEPSSLLGHIQTKTLADDVFSVSHGEGTLYAVYFTMGNQRWKQPKRMEMIGAEMERDWGVEFECVNGDRKMLWFGGVDEKEGRDENEYYQAVFNIDESGYLTTGRDHSTQRNVGWVSSDSSVGRMMASDAVKRRAAEVASAQPVAKRARLDAVVVTGSGGEESSSNDEIIALKMSIARGLSMNTELRKRNDEVVGRNALLQARVSELEVEKLGVGEALAAKEREIADLKDDNQKTAELEKTANALRAEVCALQGELLGWKSPGNDSDANTLEVALRMRMAGAEASGLRQEAERAKRELVRARVERNVATEQRKNMGLELARVQNLMLEMEMFKDEQLLALGDDVRTLAREKAAVQAKLEATERMLRTAIDGFPGQNSKDCLAVAQLSGELAQAQRALQAAAGDLEVEKHRVWDLVKTLKRAQAESYLAARIMCIGGLSDVFYEFFGRGGVTDKQIASGIRRLDQHLDGLNQLAQFDATVQSAEGALAALAVRFGQVKVELEGLRTELAGEKKEVSISHLFHTYFTPISHLFHTRTNSHQLAPTRTNSLQSAPIR